MELGLLLLPAGHYVLAIPYVTFCFYLDKCGFAATLA